ncbi:hypothetical protein AMAG_08508 [Allomyces macrogynus ATCC 38327]|uniref:Uncharacterized protein n=1 Tax=Allomyces macrogynus (strain ATCC 38327) TaxID=578462 RepID=A0A0L0SLD8_ALLM3|nr:hypothetical protein AMAG_08508 [Allomyces macrogynus ATCC 38327]|eukprot:KNE63371.1 hypothetical protein AMAG_08508 [Allomyces macrogynus ATCC 38327]
MPANQPFDLSLVTIDETKVAAKIACTLRKAERTMTTREYAAYRLHKQAHTYMFCATAFTAEYAAVRRFLANVARMPIKAVAGMQIHPKTRIFAGKR